jgi:hypothetical protein
VFSSLKAVSLLLCNRSLFGIRDSTVRRFIAFKKFRSPDCRHERLRDTGESI